MKVADLVAWSEALGVSMNEVGRVLGEVVESLGRSVSEASKVAV